MVPSSEGVKKEAMLNRIGFWQPHSVRETSAAKGFMGGLPQVHLLHPD
jgi:hypothetical protein